MFILYHHLFDDKYVKLSADAQNVFLAAARFDGLIKVAA